VRAKSLDMQVLDVLFERVGYYTHGVKRHVDRQNCKEAIFQRFKLVSEYKVLYINNATFSKSIGYFLGEERK